MVSPDVFIFWQNGFVTVLVLMARKPSSLPVIFEIWTVVMGLTPGVVVYALNLTRDIISLARIKAKAYSETESDENRR